MSTNQPTDKHRAIAREIGAIVMCPDYVERSSDDCPACLRDIAAILAKHDRPATATGEGTSRLRRAIDECIADLEQIVCVKEPDDGVVLLSHDGPCHWDEELKVQVYDHEHFSPLGDALIALHKKLTAAIAQKGTP